MNNIELLYFDRSNVSEGTDGNETWESEEFDNCRY